MINTIINSDALSALQEIECNTVDLSVFSPPYDNIREYNGNWTFDYLVIGSELFRITKDGGICAVVINDSTRNFAKSLTSFRLAVDWCDKFQWNLFETIIYHRHGRPGAWWTKRFRVDHEYILIFFKGKKPKSFHKDHLMVQSKYAGTTYSGTNRLTSGKLKSITSKIVNDTKCRGTVWKYAASNTEGNKKKLLHPATYPDKLAEDLILCFSDVGDLVLDPTCGSGTTCAMALKNNRNYVGIDISSEYCDIANERINSISNQQYSFSY